MCLDAKTKTKLWKRFQKQYREYPEIQLRLDLSRVDFDDQLFDKKSSNPLSKRIRSAFDAMESLENGSAVQQYSMEQKTTEAGS